MTSLRCCRSAAPAALFALSMGLASACSPEATAHAEGAPDGKQVFEDKKCSGCHRPGGKRDLAGVGKKFSADELKAILRQAGITTDQFFNA